MPGTICFAYVYLFKDLRGITRYTIDACNALSLRKRQVFIICPYRRDDLPRQFLHESIHVITIPHYHYKRATTIPGFLWTFLRKEFDEVYISLGFGEAYAAVIARRLRRNFHYNVLLHMPYERGYPLFAKLYERGMRIGLFHGADRIIAVSSYVRDSLRYFMDVRKVQVSYNGVDVEKFSFNEGLRKKKRDNLGIGEDELVLLTTAAVESRKNLPNILPSMKMLKDAGFMIKYIIAGSGNPRNIKDLYREIARFGLEGNVIYLGEEPSPVSLYSAADIFLLLSQYEAFGISVIEAAACGLPCITSNESAFPEIVTDDIGFMVDKTDTAAMVDVIKKLKDRKSRERYRHTARARIKEYFDIRKNVLLLSDKSGFHD